MHTLVLAYTYVSRKHSMYNKAINFTGEIYIELAKLVVLLSCLLHVMVKNIDIIFFKIQEQPMTQTAELNSQSWQTVIFNRTEENWISLNSPHPPPAPLGQYSAILQTSSEARQRHFKFSVWQFWLVEQFPIYTWAGCFSKKQCKAFLCELCRCLK